MTDAYRDKDTEIINNVLRCRLSAICEAEEEESGFVALFYICDHSVLVESVPLLWKKMDASLDSPTTLS